MSEVKRIEKISEWVKELGRAESSTHLTEYKIQEVQHDMLVLQSPILLRLLTDFKLRSQLVKFLQENEIDVVDGYCTDDMSVHIKIDSKIYHLNVLSLREIVVMREIRAKIT